jgi:chromosome segregation ATPase
MSTAKLLNGLLDSQKTDRARIKHLEARLAETDARQAAAVAAAIAASEVQCKAQLDHVHEEHAAERATRTELAASRASRVDDLAWQITVLRQELNTERQLRAASDASNEEFRGTIEALEAQLDGTAEATARLASERAEIAAQRETLSHLLDGVRAHMRKKDLAAENAILNRKVLAGATPRVNVR